MKTILVYFLGLLTLPLLAFAKVSFDDWRWQRRVVERRRRNDLLRANGIDPNRTAATGQGILERIREMRRH